MALGVGNIAYYSGAGLPEPLVEYIAIVLAPFL